MRQGSVREALIDAGEHLFATHGSNAVSLREIAKTAGANVGSLTYHFGNKAGLLREIYTRHCEPMNRRRLELLGEAKRIQDRDERLVAILRAYLLPAFSSAGPSGGGPRFTRMRAILSAEGNEEARRIIAEVFDETSRAFIDALAECVPGAPRAAIVWRSHFLLGALYYTLVNPERIIRLSDGEADGHEVETAIRELTATTAAGLLALGAPEVEGAGDRNHGNNHLEETS